eukprot:502019-Prymnesium_polylepis.1
MPLRLRGHLRKQGRCGSLSSSCAQSAAVNTAQLFPLHHLRKDHRHICRRHAPCGETASGRVTPHGGRGEQIARPRASAQDSGSTKGAS